MRPLHGCHETIEQGKIDEKAELTIVSEYFEKVFRSAPHWNITRG